MDALVRLINALVMIGLPLFLAAFLVREYKLNWMLFSFGALAFSASQILEIPFNRYLMLPLVEMIKPQALAGADTLGLGGVLFALSPGFLKKAREQSFTGYRCASTLAGKTQCFTVRGIVGWKLSSWAAWRFMRFCRRRLIVMLS